MPPITILAQIGMPIAMAIGGIAAWRLTKKENLRDEKKPAWRDTSLDDWRRERDESLEKERQERTARTPELKQGSEEEQVETQRQQRIGG